MGRKKGKGREGKYLIINEFIFLRTLRPVFSIYDLTHCFLQQAVENQTLEIEYYLWACENHPPYRVTAQNLCVEYVVN